MRMLQIRLFGHVQVSHNNWKTEVNITPVIQGLLAYLLLQRHHIHSRDELAALFWGDHNQEKARSCLNTTLWRLRSVLEPAGIPHGTYLISNHIGKVSFNQNSRYWLDVACFDEQINRILATPYESIEADDIQNLESVIQLYRGDLLEAFYDDWAISERERVRSLYLNSLAYLMRYEKCHGLYEKGLAHGREILKVDPLREEIHREMMCLYVENQQRALAVQQYRACREILNAELDIPPMAETQALFAQIALSEELPQADHAKGEQDDLINTLRDLRLAAQSVEKVHVHLSRVISFIEAFVEETPKKHPNKSAVL